nr:MAG TPA: beta-catenin [Caudoviricetes sp.]
MVQFVGIDRKREVTILKKFQRFLFPGIFLK